jgi:hypothetical protein
MDAHDRADVRTYRAWVIWNHLQTRSAADEVAMGVTKEKKKTVEVKHQILASECAGDKLSGT